MSTTTGADISECGTYRYSLWRHWDETSDPLYWVMLNPSTADAEADDPTIRRCIDWGKRLGYGGVYITNLFALRSTDPKALPKHADPIGPQNDRYLREMVAGVESAIIAAWGAHGAMWGRGRDVKQLVEDAGSRLHYLRLTKSGEPSHPLYLPKKLEPVRWA